MDIWSILGPIEIVYGRLMYFVVIWYIFSPIWYFVQRKIWQPCAKQKWKCEQLKSSVSKD
jgi:hypothetical protein